MKRILALLGALALIAAIAETAHAAPVVVAGTEVWDGAANPHAGDGVTLVPGLNSIYTIPNGMTINSPSGRIDLDAALSAPPDPNNNVTLTFAPGGGGLVLNGAINAHSGLRDFTVGIERTLTLNMNNNSITGTGDILFTPLDLGSSRNRHNVSIIGTGSVSFDDINLRHDDGGPGGNVSVNVHGSITLDHIDTADQSGGGGPGENVSLRGSSVSVGSISTFAARGGPPNDNGNVVIEALAAPAFSAANAAGNSIANKIRISGAVDIDGPAVGQPGGALTLRAVKVELPSTFSLDQQAGAPLTIRAGVPQLGFPTAALFKNEVIGFNPTPAQLVHDVQWTPPALTINTSTETFDTAASAAANGWSANNNTISGNNFGFSATNNTGGTPAGEAGGVFARSGVVGYYADTNLGGSFGRGNAFSASGEFDMTAISTAPAFDGSFGMGYFDSAGNTVLPLNDGNLDQAGVIFGEQSGTSLRAWATIKFADGTTVQDPTPLILSGLNTDRTFTLDFDPMGGANNAGQLEITFSGAGGGTTSVDLLAAHADLEFDLNAFGMFAIDHTTANAGMTVTAFLDNLTYSSFALQQAVPEPASLAAWCAMACAGIVGLGIARRRAAPR
jgi:hypothetical protein